MFMIINIVNEISKISDLQGAKNINVKKQLDFIINYKMIRHF